MLLKINNLKYINKTRDLALILVFGSFLNSFGQEIIPDEVEKSNEKVVDTVKSGSATKIDGVAAVVV